MLDGKTALITGSSHGVGLAAAKLFAKQGAKVVLHGNTNIDAASEAMDEIGENALGVVEADLSDPGAGQYLFDTADTLADGGLNVVINNAGIYLATPLDDDVTWNASWDGMLQVNLRALADISKAAVNAFRTRGGGSLVNIASRAGYRGDGPDHMGYAATKGAVLALTKTIARGYGGDGILAYALAPGWIDTRMGPASEAGKKAAQNEIPIGRIASPEEVAAMCAFLASGACESATGACIDINGASYVR